MSSEAARAPLRETLGGVLLLIALYAAVHFGLRVWASPNLGEDDPLENILVQTLRLGYSLEQRPLYEWLLWIVQQVLGSGISSFLVVKYGLLLAMGGFLFAATRHVSGSAFWGFIAVEALVMIYPVFWRMHEGYTHLVVAMALSLATVWAFLQVFVRQRGSDFAVLGGCLGLGALSEGSFLVLAGAALLATLTDRSLRARIVNPRFAVTVVVAGTVLAPHALWLFWVWPDSMALVALWGRVWESTSGVSDLWQGLLEGILQPVLSLAPYVVFLAAIFPRAFLWPASSPSVPDSGDAAGRRWLLRLLGIEGVLLLAYSMFMRPLDQMPVQDLLPMTLPAVIALTDQVRRNAPSRRRIAVFAGVALTMTILALVGRSANMFVHEPVCKICRWGVPYPELAKMIEARLTTSPAMIFSVSAEVGGNLRPYFPASKIELPGLTLPGVKTKLLTGSSVWIADGKSAAPEFAMWVTEAAVKRGVDPAWVVAQLAAQETRVTIDWTHLWRPGGYRQSTWYVAVLPAPQN